MDGSSFESLNPLVDDRPAQILQALADGKRPKQIAFELELSYTAVLANIHRIKQAIGAETTAHAVAIGIRERYID